MKHHIDIIISSPPYARQLHGMNHNAPSYEFVRKKRLPFEYNLNHEEFDNIGYLEYD